jgi:hypothetical protein
MPAGIPPQQTMKRSTWLAMLFALLPVSPAAASGQTVGATAGEINGRVGDETSAVLLGVRVTISSDALIGGKGTRATTTNDDGRYRFAALPPGEYTVVFERGGFATVVRERIYVAAGRTATIDVELRPALQETVVVEHRSTVVDRQSSAVSFTFDARQLADLPGGRNLTSLISSTPGVQVVRFDIAGNIENPGLYSAYGISGQNRPMVEGLAVSGMFASGFTLNYGSFEEVSVGTGSHAVEWPMAGVQMQLIAKSGGNRYRGTIYADYAHRSWQSFNIDDEQMRRAASAGSSLSAETNRLWQQYDVNADAGGYLRKDVVWWYGSVRHQEIAVRQVNFPVEPRRTRVTNYGGKGTYQIDGNHKLILFGQTARNYQPIRLDPFGPVGASLNATNAIHESKASTAEQTASGLLWKAEWNAVIGNALFFDLRGGQFDTSRREVPNGTAPRFEDIGSHNIQGGSRTSTQDLDRDQLFGSASYFTDSRFGSHQLKVGGEFVRSLSADRWDRGYPGDVLHVVQDGVPREVYQFETPSQSSSGLAQYALYASDSWRVSQRLTLDLGLRFDRSRVFLPEQVHPAGTFNATPQRFAAVNSVVTWNVVAPRVWLIHDFTGDGKTVAKFSYGRYWVPPGTEVGTNANPNTVDWWHSYAWSDSNGSGLWESGEEGERRGRRGGAGVESRDPDLAPSFVSEAGAWIEREVIGRTGVRTGVVWRGVRQQRLRQNPNRPFDAFTVAVLIPDPGPDGFTDTGDDGPAIRGFELRPEFLSLPLTNVLRNVPDSDSHHWTWDIFATRRSTGRWSFTAGFAHTWNRDQAGAYFGQSVRNNALPLTPNDLINAGSNGRYEFTTWTAKAYGTYEAPWRVRITPLLRHQSGQPFGRTFSTFLNYGNVRVLAEPIGTRRMPDVTILDLRVQKGFRIADGRVVSVFADVFNALNTNPEESLSWSSGPSFLQPFSILAPRIVRLGARLEW